MNTKREETTHFVSEIHLVMTIEKDERVSLAFFRAVLFLGRFYVIMQEKELSGKINKSVILWRREI